MSRATSARHPPQFGSILKDGPLSACQNGDFDSGRFQPYPAFECCTAIGPARKKASLLGSPGLVSVYVLLRDRFLVVGVSASNRSRTFPLYVFVAVYGAVVYFLCALLSPNDLSHYEGYKEYFFSRRKWFFGAMAVMFVADLSDDYIFHLVGLFILLSLFAIKLRNGRFHAAFALFALLSEIFFYLRQFFTLA